MTTARIDLNCDLGESFGRWTLGDDKQVMPSITSASIACGFHGGDWTVIDRTVGLCAASGVAVGAHPSYPDLQGFGRRSLAMEPKEIEQAVIYQLGALAGFCRAHDVRLRFAKPHGALYNDAAVNPAIAWAIVHGIRRFDAGIALVGLASSKPFRDAAADAGIRFVAEGFADRRYLADGSLAPRSRAGSVQTDIDLVVEQAVAIASGAQIQSLDGGTVTVQAETICIHGDTAGAPALAKALREKLALAGIQVTPFA